MCDEINIKEQMPSVSEALENLKGFIKIKRSFGYRCLVVVHGYGSSGKGGAICKKVREYLLAQEKNKKLRGVVFGEDFNPFNAKALSLKSRYRELDKYFCAYNHGITIIEL